MQAFHGTEHKVDEVLPCGVLLEAVVPDILEAVAVVPGTDEAALLEPKLCSHRLWPVQHRDIFAKKKSNLVLNMEYIVHIAEIPT